MKAPRRLTAVVALAPLLLAAGGSAPDPARVLAGRYYAQSTLRIVGFESEPYLGEDVVEIVPVAARTAYVRVHLDYDNGHYCAIYGIAHAEGDALVYRDPRRPVREHGSCTLSVRKSGRSLVIDDGKQHGCFGYCGVRGSLTDVKISYVSKRPIRYMSRLKASREYREAMAEWQAGKAVQP